MQDFINLRKEMNECMDNHGHWGVLRRAVPGAKCPCVNPQTDDAAGTCTLCLSTGRVYVDQFIKLRKSRPVKITQMLGAETRAAVGQMTPTDNIFYLEYTEMPSVQDFILELKLDFTSGEPVRPYTVIGVYDVSDSREHRDKFGRVEFFSVTAETQAWPEFNIG